MKSDFAFHSRDLVTGFNATNYLYKPNNTFTETIETDNTGSKVIRIFFTYVIVRFCIIIDKQWDSANSIERNVVSKFLD